MNDWPLMAPGAGWGAKTNDSASRVLALCTMQAPEAPSPAADGMVTAMVKYMATAASVALPPDDSTSRPTSAARLSSAEAAANFEPPVSIPAMPARFGLAPLGSSL